MSDPLQRPMLYWCFLISFLIILPGKKKFMVASC